MNAKLSEIVEALTSNYRVSGEDLIATVKILTDESVCPQVSTLRAIHKIVKTKLDFEESNVS